MFTKEDNEVLDRILEARKTCRAFSDEMPTDDEIKECDGFVIKYIISI